MKSYEKVARAILSRYRDTVARHGELLARMEKCQGTARQTIQDEVQVCDQTLAGIQTVINQMESLRHKRILELRYIDGASWRMIQNKLYIARSTCSRSHREALSIFGELWQKLQKDGTL